MQRQQVLSCTSSILVIFLSILVILINLQNVSIAQSLNPANIPVIHIEKVSGYAGINQYNVNLVAGKIYSFSCRIPGLFRQGVGDHIPEFWVFQVPEEIGRVQYVYSNGWTTVKRQFRAKVSGNHRIALAIWNEPTFEVTDISLVDDLSGINVLINSDLSNGLSDWVVEFQRLYKN